MARRANQAPEPQDILERYSRPHWGDLVPVLEGVEWRALKAYFEREQMVASASSRPFSQVRPKFELGIPPERQTVGRVLVLNDHAMTELKIYADGVVGPYFLGNAYYPNGVAVWRHEPGQRRNETRII